ncbi:acyltransferase [Zooshikella ganghwensis]|uniref:Acyltransferase n=1 Tax=Zooshikella ganghwensis TaxID=202772 RepID=A0A4P9VMQ2_9GAMM|nr:acyltransferase [Zooshikella ganghwensis]RDH43202.1 acyltransferase [Zooshikella ganghwensis]
MSNSTENDYKIICELLGEVDNEKIELLEKILSIYQQLHKNKLNKFNRSLPLAELLVDRWERASLLGFGEGTSIYDSVIVIGEVVVGESTWIGPNVLLDGSGSLEIGSNCSVSAQVQIYSHNSVMWAISGGKEPYEYAKTKIGNNCYIGPNVVIEKGITIGNGCIIGANSFVNSSFPDNSKIAGSPASFLLK